MMVKVRVKMQLKHVMASGACKDKGTVRVKVDRCKGESEDDSEREGKRKDEAEVEIKRGDR